MFASHLSVLFSTFLAGTLLASGPIPLKERLRNSLGHRYIRAKQKAQTKQKQQAIQELSALAQQTQGTTVSHAIQKQLSKLASHQDHVLEIEVTTSLSSTNNKMRKSSTRRAKMRLRSGSPLRRALQHQLADTTLSLTIETLPKHVMSLSGWLVRGKQKRSISLKTQEISSHSQLNYKKRLVWGDITAQIEWKIQASKKNLVVSMSAKRSGTMKIYAYRNNHNNKRSMRITMIVKEVMLRHLLDHLTKLNDLKPIYEKGLPLTKKYSIQVKSVDAGKLLTMVCKMAGLRCIRKQQSLLVDKL